jgi:two-component system, OmpR family, phosphate regulon sensor histidine kinase PhoR
MSKGGMRYSDETIAVLRLIRVVIAPLTAIYALLVILGVVPIDRIISTPVAFSLLFSWVLISLYYYLKPANEHTDNALRLVLLHFFALAICIFIIGFIQPFMPFYIVLVISAYFYYGRLGYGMSIAALLVALAIDTLMYATPENQLLLQNVLVAISVVFLSAVVTAITSSQETRRRALLHSQNRERWQYDRMTTIMNNLTDAAFSTDDKGAILMYNAACLDLLDTNDTLKGRPISELFHLTDKDNQPIELADILSSATRTIRRDDLNHTYKDGESIRLEITLSPIKSTYSISRKSTEQAGYILIMRDVTKQKSLEEERDEFISVVSHELRTPVTIVEGSLSNLEVLMNRPQLPAKTMLKETVTTAHEQVLYLAKMINDLSTLSRAERGVGDEAESIDVTELLHDLHQQYEKSAHDRKLELNIELGHALGTVKASRLYLEELLQNFITNAIKYTEKGSVTIVAHKSKNIITFSVKDTGIGISRGDQTKIFNKFYRSEDYRIRETNGTGLGLYVSAKLAHKLHTRIELKSRLNHGSTFSFQLEGE